MAGLMSPASNARNAGRRTLTSYAFAGYYEAPTVKLTFCVTVFPEGLSVILISSR